MRNLFMTLTVEADNIPTVEALKQIHNVPVKVVSISEYDTELKTTLDVHHFVISEYTDNYTVGQNSPNLLFEQLRLVKYVNDNRSFKIVYRKQDLPDFLVIPNGVCIDNHILSVYSELSVVNWKLLDLCLHHLGSNYDRLKYLYSNLIENYNPAVVKELKEVLYFMFAMQRLREISKTTLLLDQELSCLESGISVDSRKIVSLLSTLKHGDIYSISTTLEEHVKSYENGYYHSLFKEE